jgi:hypothetical protein
MAKHYFGMYTGGTLVATQSDIRDENNSDHVSDTEGQNLMKLINADYYNTCSAATNDGIKKVFESVVLRQ